MTKPLYSKNPDRCKHLWAALEDCKGCREFLISQHDHDRGRHAICARCNVGKVFPPGMLLTRSELEKRDEPPPQKDPGQVAAMIAGIGK